MKRLITFIALSMIVLTVGVVTGQDEAPPFLGITFDANDDGAVITHVLPDTPADEAGLEVGDIITGLNDEDVSADTLTEAVRQLNAGDNITLDILRDGEAQELEATLGEQPEDSRFQFELNPMQIMERAYLGIGLEDTDDGVTINSVSEESPAAEAGLQVDDIITSINNTAIEASADAVSLVRELEPGDNITLNIVRDGEEMTVEATLGSTSGFEIMNQGDIIIHDGENWRVMVVSEEGALAEAGLQPGDVITAINGESTTPESLSELEGDVTLSIERDGETLDITVPADALDVFGRFNIPPQFFGDGFGLGNVRLGVAFANIDEEVAAENDLSVTEGALITEVLPDSPAAEAGLQVDDVVVSVNGDVVDAERSLRERLFAYEPEDTVTLEVLRGDETLNIDVTLTGGDMANMPFFNMDELPFEFGEDGALRFFFGPDGSFNFDDIPFEEAVPAPNV